MKKLLLLGSCLTILWVTSFVACGGPEPVCIPGSTQECSCPNDKNSSQVCKSDGTGYDACDCQAVSSETTKEPTTEASTEPKTEEEPASTTPEEAPNAEEPSDDKDASAPKDDDVEEKDPKEEAPEPVKEDGPEEVNCDALKEFKYNNKCYSIDDFCQGKLKSAGFPEFTAEEQAQMRTPYALEYDPVSNKPWFCQTLPNHYYTDKTSYQKCDSDEDGWLNLSGYKALNSSNKVIQRNARCSVRNIKMLTYKSDPQNWPQNSETVMEQPLPKDVPLVESDRNDGIVDKTEMPVYTNAQKPLPTQRANNCKSDKDCFGQDEVCYIGHCIAGRRFKAKEMNSATKGCIAGLDLNGNGIQDASENPQSNVATELKPFLTLGFYLELQQGTLIEKYQSKSGIVNTWQITERSRTGQPGKRDALALKCQEDANGFQSNYWRQCGLRDDQTCTNSGGTGVRNGLSPCLRDKIQHATPSLFKCVVFDSSTDKTKRAGFFNPENYGLSKNFNRPICRADKAVKGSNFEDDVLFVCGADTGKNKPLGAKEVGWACVNFKSYTKPADYLAGCISEMAHEVCGPPGGKDKVTYLVHEKASYGLARANRECGAQSTTGPCARALQVCTGGKWLACNQCNNCPQTTSGQQTICPGGVWPQVPTQTSGQNAPSCRTEVKPSTEVCDGKDNDCNGQIDDGLPTVQFYPDTDKDGYGDKKGTPIAKCEAQKPVGYVKNNTDCNDKVKTINPKATDICDGIDNNCDGNADEDAQDLNWYPDADKDTYGASTRSFIGCKKDANTACTGLNQCRSTAGFVNRSGDCCDSDPDAKPGQTQYFATKNKCGSFDYNCNKRNETDPQDKLCQCSTQLQYNINAVAEVYVDNRGWSTWWSTALNNQSYTNATCVLSKTWTFQPPNNLDLQQSCLWTGCCRYIGTYCRTPCPQNCTEKVTLKATDIAASWTPKYNSGTNFLMWRSSNHSTGCLYKADGAKPTCGEQGIVAKGKESSFTYNKVLQNTKTITGDLDCSKCSKKELKKSFGYYDRYKYEVKVNNGYIFTQPSTQTKVVKCR